MYDNISIVQSKLKELLKIFADICEENNLRYFLIAGTLLGAVRHQDIIPWDDDIDVGMPRADYDRFMVIAQAKLNEKYPNKYFIQTGKTDKYYHKFIARMRENDTDWVEKAETDNRMRQGLFIDVFPLDGLPNDDKKRAAIARRINKLSGLSSIRFSKDYKSGKKLLIPIKFMLKHFTTYSFFHNLANKIITRYDFEKSQYAGSLLSNYGVKSHFKRSYFDDYVLLPFGDRAYRCPYKHIEMLTDLYGDYNELPPMEKRIAKQHVVYVGADNKK